MVTFFKPLDLFKNLFIVLLGYNNFEHGSIAGFIEFKVKVNPKFMQIVVLSENSPDSVI